MDERIRELERRKGDHQVDVRIARAVLRGGSEALRARPELIPAYWTSLDDTDWEIARNLALLVIQSPQSRAQDAIQKYDELSSVYDLWRLREAFHKYDPEGHYFDHNTGTSRSEIPPCPELMYSASSPGVEHPALEVNRVDGSARKEDLIWLTNEKMDDFGDGYVWVRMQSGAEGPVSTEQSVPQNLTGYYNFLKGDVAEFREQNGLMIPDLKASEDSSNAEVFVPLGGYITVQPKGIRGCFGGTWGRVIHPTKLRAILQDIETYEQRYVNG